MALVLEVTTSRGWPSAPSIPGTQPPKK